jgi:hypothetical protein
VLIHVPPDVRVLAMDVHKNTISTGLLEPGLDSPVMDKLSADDESVRRLIARFEAPERVWACYEAGPTGYELARVLRSAGMRCEVIAPSLIPWQRPTDGEGVPRVTGTAHPHRPPRTTTTRAAHKERGRRACLHTQEVRPPTAAQFGAGAHGA